MLRALCLLCIILSLALPHARGPSSLGRHSEYHIPHSHTVPLTFSAGIFPETLHVPSAPLANRPAGLAATSSIANDLSAAIAAALSKHESSLDANVIMMVVASALSPNIPPSNAVTISTTKLFSQVIMDSMNELLPHIIKALKDGLKTYVPLVACTHKSCRTASHTVDSFDNSELSVTDKGEFKVKHKSMNPAHDHLITTDDFSQIRENYVCGICKHLILAGETETGSASENACTDMFAEFFSNITSRPDWMEDWSLYRGYLIDCYTAWIAHCNDSFSMIFSDVAYEKFKLKSLTPSIIEIVHQQMISSSDSSNHPTYNNNNGRGRGNGPSTPHGPLWQFQFLKSQYFLSYSDPKMLPLWRQAPLQGPSR
jgi:hypothetical protein